MFEIVDRALQALQQAGVELIEWRAVLYHRMSVPIVIKNFSYVVPDEKLQEASNTLSTLGLPLTPPTKFMIETKGDFCAKGRFHRITHRTDVASVQYVVLYPLSFSTLSSSELKEDAVLWDLPPSNPDRRLRIPVPRQAAVYASLVRMMLQCTEYNATYHGLQSDLSELIGYNLYGMSMGYVDTNNESLCEELEVDRRIEDAAHIVRAWAWDGE